MAKAFACHGSRNVGAPDSLGEVIALV